MIDMAVRIGTGVLPNPVGVASGIFGCGEEYEPLIDLSRLGALYTKAITLAPRNGNPPPRLVETPSGLLNSIGLANAGVEKFIEEKIPFLSRIQCPVVANIAGATEEEYCHVVERLESCGILLGYEINVSCPNVKHGGMAFGTDPVLTERLTSSLRLLTRKPIIVKLTPNVTDITVIAKAAENGGADAVSCINTCIGMVIDIKEKRPVFSMKTGGLSGPAVRPIGVAAVYKVSRAVSIPVIGMGGIMCADDAIQYLLAGAAAIQIGTAVFVDPHIPINVLNGIEDYCRKNNISSVTQIRNFLMEDC